MRGDRRGTVASRQSLRGLHGLWFQNSQPKSRVATPHGDQLAGLCIPQPALWVSRAKVVPSRAGVSLVTKICILSTLEAQAFFSNVGLPSKTQDADAPCRAGRSGRISKHIDFN